MEYIDRQQDIRLTDEDYKCLIDLSRYLLSEVEEKELGIMLSNIKPYRNGLRVETFSQPEYKDLPIDWVIKLFL